MALTPEDSAIMKAIWKNRPRAENTNRAILSYQADTIDAELMRQASEIADFGPAAIQLFGIDCRGWSLVNV